MKANFRRLELLGRGSYGEVFKAEWNGQLVAVKELHESLWRADDMAGPNSKGYVAQFQAECSVLEKLDHKNVVKLLKFEISNSSPPQLITELLDCDLWRHITSLHPDKIPFPETVSIMSDVAEGLAYLHERNPPIVHRDLACKNILLTREKQAKIADLGLAKVFPRNEKAMYASPVPGTPVYAAPETFPATHGNANDRYKVEYNAKIDIFSYGVILMAVINGTLPVPKDPFTKDGERIEEHKRRESDIKKMGEHKLKKIVLRCIKDSSKDRPSAEEVSKWLQYEWSKIEQKQRIVHKPKVPKLEIAVLGKSCAGKSCLISYFLDHKFADRMIPTCGQVLRTTNIDLHDKGYCLQIEDTAGQERFHSIISASINRCQGVVLVFDLTDRRSLFEDIPKLLKLVKDHAPDSTSMILVGNKADLADAQLSKREIHHEEAERFAQKRGIPYIETSALSGQNVERAFELIANEIYDTLDMSDIDLYVTSEENIKLKLTNEDVPRDKTFLQKMTDCFRRLRGWWRS